MRVKEREKKKRERKRENKKMEQNDETTRLLIGMPPMFYIFVKVA